MTPQELRTAALAESTSYKLHKATVAMLYKQGRPKEAKALQEEYNDRLNGWKQILRKAYWRNNVK